MARHSMERKRTTPRPTRRRLPVSALAAIGAAVAAVWLLTSAADGRAARGGPATPPVTARLAEIPSHDRLYRASLIPSAGTIGRRRPLTWTLEVRTAAGSAVEGAAIELESWMPDEARVVAERPRATAELGGGRYRVEGLRFDRLGWWNVKLRIAGSAGTDSLAFNLVLQTHPEPDLAPRADGASHGPPGRP